jgi:hypothetical protein
MLMPKPRRKHPGFNSIDLSLQGRQFLAFLTNAVGEGIGWRALGSTRDRFHVFDVRGERDRVILVEAPDRIEAGVLVGRMAFRHAIPEMPLVSHVEVVTHRIDPWIWAKGTGDRSIVDLTEHPRRKEADRRSAQTGNARDRITMTLAPASATAEELAGLAWSRVEEILAEAVARTATAATPGDVEDALACPVCGRLCTRAEAATHICDRLEFSVN